eukprot:TRINITY_DN11664_c0_g1_i1.p1 TRINITY_DN11664_c0_g1~~TRINITY_DN11664_c0_g1_i1.p1  ORF type:complete len:644 (+),score=87.99 TRINITY_DN11664_c0_g1_i1:73-2004(+)
MFVQWHTRAWCSIDGETELRQSLDSENEGLMFTSQRGQPFYFAGTNLLEHPSQEDIFQVSHRFFEAATLGINAVLFVYGSPGSGKTYTTIGSSSTYRERGVIPRLIECLTRDDIRHTLTMNVSCVEFVEDDIRDLSPLRGGSSSTSLRIVETKQGQVSIPGLTEVPVSSLPDTLETIFAAHSSRKGIPSKRHYHHSGHFVITISFSRDGAPMSKLHIVELASATRGAGTKAQTYVNRSLSSLERYIVDAQRLGKEAHYRDSNVCFYLHNCLGVGCMMGMITCIDLGLTSDDALLPLRFCSNFRAISLATLSSSPSLRVPITNKIDEALRDTKAAFDLFVKTSFQQTSGKASLIQEGRELLQDLTAMITLLRKPLRGGLPEPTFQEIGDILVRAKVLYSKISEFRVNGGVSLLSSLPKPPSQDKLKGNSVRAVHTPYQSLSELLEGGLDEPLDIAPTRAIVHLFSLSEEKLFQVFKSRTEMGKCLVLELTDRKNVLQGYASVVSRLQERCSKYEAAIDEKREALSGKLNSEERTTMAFILRKDKQNLADARETLEQILAEREIASDQVHESRSELVRSFEVWREDLARAAREVAVERQEEIERSMLSVYELSFHEAVRRVSSRKMRDSFHQSLGQVDPSTKPRK